MRENGDIGRNNGDGRGDGDGNTVQTMDNDRRCDNVTDEGDGGSGDAGDNNNNGVLLVLTLKCHQDGIWIHRLVEALESTRSRLRRRWRRDSESNNDHLLEKEDSRSNDQNIEIQVIALEDLLSDPFLVAGWFSPSCMYNDNLKSDDGEDEHQQQSRPKNHGRKIVGLVNRVSDAASPVLFKACIGILSSAEQRKIPVFNGSQSYAISCNKWCHHVLFHQAKLQSPITVAYFNSSSTSNGAFGPATLSAVTATTSATMESKKSKFQMATEMIIRQQQGQQEEGQKLQQAEDEHTSTTFASTKKRMLDSESEKQKDRDFLIKPNAGGFGEGIVRVTTRTSDDDNTAAAATPTLPQHPKYSDHMSLVQEYVPPYNQRLYRIWYLCGKVQCAVERRLNVDTDNQNEEFTTACAGGGGTCSIRPKSNKKNEKQQSLPQHSIFQQFVAWKIPQDVVAEIEQNFLPTLPSDAHCGSVEFLVDPSSRQRLYFDWNLLSTLPINVEEESRTSVWSDTYNPWDELAIAIWKFVLPRS